MTALADVGVILSLMLSGWATYTSHKARTWQRRRDEESRQTRARIEFEHEQHEQPWIVFAGDPDPRPSPRDYLLRMVVINSGETTEYVRDVFVDLPSGPLRIDKVGGSGDSQLVPRGRVVAEMPIAMGSLRQFGAGFRGRALLASGAQILSEDSHLDGALIAALESHNARARP